ncbi:MAG: folate-binding protein YgfZ [Gammaproteobacteria bacterium]|nr:hypothetical protein [Gammaproteobacteria bacterium]NNC96538.1 folate-binding protein YgfZ [Gammaproteobacteria bacterium]NNM13042.1 folate-binding protein YgfZ [Gammaproteobacteria bacterium]
MDDFSTLIRSEPGCALLSQSGIVQVNGADAEDFLQGQLTQDIRSIEMHSAKLSGLSNPKGRLLATPFVYRADNDDFLLCLPVSIIESVRAHLQKYVMRAKVTLQVRDDLKIYASWNIEDSLLKQELGSFGLADHCNLRMHISSDEQLPNHLRTESGWRLQKIFHAIPDVFSKTSEHFVAQMLNLDVLQAVSFNKGCYTGQEVIARMQHLGRIKRRMLILKIDQSNSELKIDPGEKLIRGETVFGEIVSASTYAEAIYVLAVVQLDKLENIDLNEIGMHKLPMPYNLD